MADKSKAILFGRTCAVEIAGTPVIAESEDLACKDVVHAEPEDGFSGTINPGKARRTVLKTDVSGGVRIKSATYAEMIALLTGAFPVTGGSYTNSFFSGYTLRELPVDPTASAYTATVKCDRKSASGKVYQYLSCWRKALELSWAEGEPLKLAMEFLGTTETEETATISAAEASLVAKMADASLTVATDTYYAKTGKIRIEYDFEDRFHNSLTRVAVGAKLLKVTAELGLDLNTDTWLLFKKNITNNDAVALNFKAASGSVGFGLDIPEACVSGATPSIGGVDAQVPNLMLRGYKSSTVATPTVCAWTKAA